MDGSKAAVYPSALAKPAEPGPPVRETSMPACRANRSIRSGACACSMSVRSSTVLEARPRAKKDVPLSQRESIGNDDTRIYPSADPSDPAQIAYASTGEPVTE